MTGYCSQAALEQAVCTLQGHLTSISTTIFFSTGGYDGAPIDYLINGPGPLMMSTCIAAIWERPETAKDELLDRLRNAIILISQADEIALEPIALSLTFAAIEALVCEEGEVPVNKQVKRHVATLLVQDPAKRKGKKGAEAVIDKLYDIRSNVLHGSKIHFPEVEELNEAGRSVASGVILAVAYWRENQLKCGCETSWKELLDELNAASRKPSTVVGVPEDLSHLIPDEVLTWKFAK